MKNTLLYLPCLQQVNGQASGKPSDTYINYVTKSITKVERRIKVLSYPIDIIEETYINLVEEQEQDQKELTRILEMRGAKAPQNKILEHEVVKNIKEGVVDFFRNNWETLLSDFKLLAMMTCSVIELLSHLFTFL